MLECVELLTRLGDSDLCHLEWVPGHWEIRGNENVDLQTNIGSITEFVGPQPATLLSLSSVKLISNFVYEIGGDNPKLFFPKLNGTKQK